MRPDIRTSLKPGLLEMPVPPNCGKGSCSQLRTPPSHHLPWISLRLAVHKMLPFPERHQSHNVPPVFPRGHKIYLRCVPTWEQGSILLLLCREAAGPLSPSALHCHNPRFHFSQYQALIFIRWVKICKECRSKPFKRPTWDLCNFNFFFSFSFPLFKQKKYDFPPPQQCNQHIEDLHIVIPLHLFPGFIKHICSSKYVTKAFPPLP